MTCRCARPILTPGPAFQPDASSAKRRRPAHSCYGSRRTSSRTGRRRVAQAAARTPSTRRGTSSGTPWSAGSTGSSATVPSPPATTSSPSATRPPSTSPPSESGSGLSLLRHGLGLDGRSHEDFADVDGVRLRDRERDRVGYCLRRHGHRVSAGGQQCGFAGVTSGGDEVGAGETRRDECAAQALGSQFLSHYLAQGAYRGLGGGVNGLAGNPLVGSGGRDRDEVARSLGPEDRQGGGDTVQDAAQVHVDHLVPVIYLA